MLNDFRIATWNIGSIHEINNYSESFFSVIHDLNADILCLQEVPEDEKFFDEVMKMRNFCDYRYVHCCKSHLGKCSDMGIALFADREITSLQTYKLIKPYEQLVSFDGRTEDIHDKSFMAVLIDDVFIVTGHGFPSYRYCCPKLMYKDEMKKNWNHYCMKVDDYRVTFLGLQEWLIGLCRTEPKVHNKIVIAADFNVDEPLVEMPVLKDTHFDVFSGIMTRPKGKYGFEYKTDGVLVPNGTAFSGKTVLQNQFDHYAIASTIHLGQEE